MIRLDLEDADIFQGDLILVSAAHPLLSPAKGLAQVWDRYPDVHLNVRARHALKALMDVLSCGDAIVPVSAYRAHWEQMEIYKQCLLERGADYTAQFVALPGCSEHQTGLAIDLGENRADLDFIAPDFPNAGACGHFLHLAPQFGFVRRYEAGKEAVTGIACEPWHFRYVGCPHSEIMAREGLCLEEYLQWLRQFPQEAPLRRDNVTVFFSPRRKNWTLFLPGDAEFTVSGNNIDGCIITLWEDVT